MQTNTFATPKLRKADSRDASPITPVDPLLRHSFFCSIPGTRHMDGAKEIYVTNTIARAAAPSRELSLLPNNLFL